MVRTDTIKRLHVDQHALRRNSRRDDPATWEPALTVQNRGRSTKAFEISFEAGTMRQSKKPISCGARVWIETRGRVVADGKVIE